MALLPIIIAPDPRLKVKCDPVENVDDGVRTLMDDMLVTMYAAPGLGLAAPQVGVQKRILVADVSKDENLRDPKCLINPEITWASEELFEYEEGCLSLPDHFAEISRPERVRISYLDRDGKSAKLEADGVLAVCIQHEMDHLDGILFVDYLSKLKRNVILRKLRKLKKQNPEKAVGA
ncbi:MAG: peptide deformylase [Rhodospirillales bacterium]|nr:peptide deformylase [Rhodospirillales bacterium]